MSYYQKMTNVEVLRLQEALGKHLPHVAINSMEASIFLAFLAIVLQDVEDVDPYGVFMILGCWALIAAYRYFGVHRRKAREIKKDLFHLEMENEVVQVDYQIYDEKSGKHWLFVAGSNEKIQVDGTTNFDLKRGDQFRLLRSRFAQIVVGYEKLN
ncbi:MAG: hypothetical protein AAF433_13000 [Bacteroidota bacterium]